MAPPKGQASSSSSSSSTGDVVMGGTGTAAVGAVAVGPAAGIGLGAATGGAITMGPPGSAAAGGSDMKRSLSGATTYSSLNHSPGPQHLDRQPFGGPGGPLMHKSSPSLISPPNPRKAGLDPNFISALFSRSESEEDKQVRADSIKEMDLRLNELLRGMLEATLDPPGSSDSSSTVERFPQGSLRIAGAHLLGVYEAKATMDLVFVCCTKGVPVPPDLETRLLNAFRLHEHLQTSRGVVDVEFRNFTYRLSFCFAEDADISEADLLGDSVEVFEKLKPAAKTALSGLRIGRKLLSLVPDAALFQGVLLLVKHWARLRGIYGSTFGYFSGLAWALVAAKACIKHEGSQEMQDFDGQHERRVLQMFHKFLEEFHKHSWQQPLYLIPRPGATDTRPVPDSSLSRSATAPAPAGGANPSSSSSSGNNTNSILNTSNLPNGSNNVHNVGKSSSTGAAAGSAQNAANTASALATALANHPGISRASSSSSLNNNNPMEMSYSRISWSPEYEGFETDSAEEMERSHSATNQSGTEPQAANGHLYDGGTQKRRKVQQQTEEYLRNAIRIMTPCQPVENAAFATSRNTSHVLEEEIYRGRSAVMSAQRQAAMTAIDSKAAKEKKTTAEKKKSMVAETQALWTESVFAPEKFFEEHSAFIVVSFYYENLPVSEDNSLQRAMPFLHLRNFVSRKIQQLLIPRLQDRFIRQKLFSQPVEVLADRLKVLGKGNWHLGREEESHDRDSQETENPSPHPYTEACILGLSFADGIIGLDKSAGQSLGSTQHKTVDLRDCIDGLFSAFMAKSRSMRQAENGLQVKWSIGIRRKNELTDKIDWPGVTVGTSG